MKLWYSVSYYNKNLTYEQNMQNGVTLPKENIPVVCYRVDVPYYFVGRFTANEDGLLCFDARTGDKINTTFVEWQEFILHS